MNSIHWSQILDIYPRIIGLSSVLPKLFKTNSSIFFVIFAALFIVFLVNAKLTRDSKKRLGKTGKQKNNHQPIMVSKPAKTSKVSPNIDLKTSVESKPGLDRSRHNGFAFKTNEMIESLFEEDDGIMVKTEKNSIHMLAPDMFPVRGSERCDGLLAILKWAGQADVTLGPRIKVIDISYINQNDFFTSAKDKIEWVAKNDLRTLVFANFIDSRKESFQKFLSDANTTLDQILDSELFWRTDVVTSFGDLTETHLEALLQTPLQSHSKMAKTKIENMFKRYGTIVYIRNPRDKRAQAPSVMPSSSASRLNSKKEHQWISERELF